MKEEAKPKAYLPSNGTEGMGFEEIWCDECIRQAIDPHAKTQCTHHGNAYFNGANGVWFWIDGKPTCTAFKSRAQYNRIRKRQTKVDKRQKRLFK